VGAPLTDRLACQQLFHAPIRFNIDIDKMAFPDNTDVEKGDTVTWTNRMNMGHTVTVDNGWAPPGKLDRSE
jgi:plastocyanin